MNGITAIKLTNNVSSASWQYFSYEKVDVEGMEPDSDYTVSFDILASGFGKSLTIRAGLQNGDGTSNIAPYKTLGVISDDVWFTLSAVLHTRSDIKPIDQDLYCTGLALVPGASVTLKNLKIEKGNKPTAWSPAPEDFDGKYTSKTEFKQTTDKISATATAASQNASSALSKVSSLEVSVDGIDAKVEENASDIADAVKTTSQVSQRVDSLSSTITQVQGDISDLDDAVSEAQKDADTATSTANSALSKSSSVEQNLNSFKTSVSQTYETKSDASSKQSSLQQSVNNLRTEVSQT